MKSDFNPAIFSHNFHDYFISKELNREKTIFLANFTPLNVLCTIRIIAKLAEERELYENECCINRKLKHSNLMQYYQHFFLGQALVSVGPYCEYGTINKVSQACFGLRESITALVLSDILKAVDYLHQNLIIHRAIKGSHIHIISTGHETITFLLSGLKYSLDLSDKTQTLQSHSYPINASHNLHCMAPEMFEQNTIGYNYKADIYSIGLLCCELSNGFVPFYDAPNDELLLCKILGNQPLLLDSTVIPQSLSSLKNNCPEQPMNEIPDKLKKRHEKYLLKRYTEKFKDFVSVGCLHIEPARRLNASELLAHPFITEQGEKAELFRILKKNFTRTI